MTDLRELLEEIAGTQAPPSRSDARRVFEAGRRRHRRRRNAASIAAALALAVLGGVGALTALTPDDRRDAPLSDDTTSIPRRDPNPGAKSPSDIIQWSAAADARRLYAIYLACTGSVCPKTAFDLVGSDDGGRTWTTRKAGHKVYGWRVVGQGALIANPHADRHGLMVSTDGGRTWPDLVVQASAVPEVPAGGAAICYKPDESAPCKLFAIDPTTRRLAPLGSQPSISIENWAVVQDVGGRLWASGTDRMTGLAASAMSPDRGRTWTTHVFADPPGCNPQRCGGPELASVDGRTVYATVFDSVAKRRTVYRGVDNAGWQPLDTADIPSSETLGWSFVTADSAHVICVYREERTMDAVKCQYWMLGPSGAYQQVTLDGLPGDVRAVKRTPDGWFHAHSGHGIFGSADGRRWSILAGR